MDDRQKTIDTAASLMRMALALLDRVGEADMAAYLSSALEAGGYDVPLPPGWDEADLVEPLTE